VIIFLNTEKEVIKMAFTHLHTHTEYSLLDGSNKIKDYVKRVKELGMTSAAITDHGVMYGVIQFYKECKAQGINPVLGCEVYVAPNSRFDKQGSADDDSKYNHLVLLVENEKGYQNLCKLVSAGFTEGFYYKPRVDKELLRQHSEGLICLSACLAGEVPQALLKGDYNKAKNIALEYQSIFGKENFFIELQDHGIKEQKMTNPDLIRLAKEIGAELVVTNDAHYTNKEDAEAQDILLCIQTDHKVSDEKRMRFETQEFYVKSEEEMRSLFPAFPEAYDNTQKIADRCKFDFVFGQVKLPVYEVPEKFETHFDYFKHLCDTGMIKRYGENFPKEYQERLDYELDVINRMGYTDYFLIVWDFINYARQNDIPVGPGRGSGAGSIAAYAVGITNIDPMKYKLVFERFLNPERVSMPDFDIDFCYERRHEVIDYVVNKYGRERVSQIVTYMTMAAKGSIRDVGRVLDYPYSDVDKIAKLIPKDPKITIAKALELSAEFRQEYDNNPVCKHIIDIAMKIEGLPKSTSKHAAGVLICDKSIVEYAPLKIDDEGELVIQATMTELEDLGLLKFDFLGLRTLTVIKDTEKKIREKNPSFNIEEIPLDDSNVMHMLSLGNSLGVFQLESGGMKGVLTGLKPNSIEELTALISLYRPGPMDSIPTFIHNKNNPADVSYDTPELEHILNVTYGTIVYQEQVMQIVRDLGGYTYGRSDLVRRAMSKKKAAIMEAERQNFVYGGVTEDGVEIPGCIKKGISESVANKIYDDMISFAAYAFNKSHAACYAVIAYQTAYLKYYYPVEFMAAMLTSVIESDKLGFYCNSVQKEMGIPILPPDFNESEIIFTATDEGQIRFGLSALKGVGKSVIGELMAERENGSFKSFYDFAKRMAGTKFNKKAYEAMIKAGAFDSTEFNRRTLMENYDKAVAQATQEAKSRSNGQMSLFDLMSDDDVKAFSEPQFKLLDEYGEEEKLKYEREVTNLFISGHPLNKYTKAIQIANAASIGDILESIEAGDGRFKAGQFVNIACVLFDVEKRLSKKGNKMALFKMQDITSDIGAIAFATTVEESGFLLEDNNCVIVKGKIDVRDDDSVQFVCNNVYLMPNDSASVEEFNSYQKLVGTKTGYKQNQPKTQAPQQMVKPRNAHEKYGKGLYIKVPTNDKIEPLLKVVRTIPGTLPVYIYCEADNKIYRNDNMMININESKVLKQIIDMIGPGNYKFYKN
jgi:DNA polymerase-3 subunit alpha